MLCVAKIAMLTLKLDVIMALSVTCKDTNLNYKLDLRIITDTEDGLIEEVTGEFAITETTTRRKLYSDRLKSILCSECHLNALTKKTRILASLASSRK